MRNKINPCSLQGSCTGTQQLSTSPLLVCLKVKEIHWLSGSAKLVGVSVTKLEFKEYKKIQT